MVGGGRPLLPEILGQAAKKLHSKMISAVLCVITDRPYTML